MAFEHSGLAGPISCPTVHPVMEPELTVGGGWTPESVLSSSGQPGPGSQGPVGGVVVLSVHPAGP